MANPRQRRKARSATHKPVHHSRHAKKMLKKMPPIRGPKALQDAWDKCKTVRQNYAALGLVADLNPIESGGTELQQGEPEAAALVDEANAEARRSTSLSNARIPAGRGRILRNAAGAITGVELAEDEERPEEDPEKGGEMMKDAEIDSGVRSDWVGMQTDSRAQSRTGGHVVTALESLAAGDAPRARYTPAGERTYLTALVAKHGDDVEAMARDRRLNTEQRTGGELRRAIRNAGGMEAFVATGSQQSR